MTTAEQPARPAAVVVLAAGNGTRMKSKLMKVLHPVGGRSMIGHVLTAAAARRAAAPRRGGRQQPRAGRPAHPRPGAERAAGRAGDPGRHRARRTGRAGRPPRRRRYDGRGGRGDGRRHPADGGGDASPAWSRRTPAADRAITVLTAEVADPFGYGRILRDASGAVDRDRRGEGRHRRAGRGPRDQQRHLRLRRGLPRRRAGPDHQRQRQGRVLPHRRGRHRPPGRPCRRRAPHRRRDADRGRQRPRPAGRPGRRAEPPDPGPLDARRGDDRRPGEHLDRRRRGARAATSRSCPASSCSAPRSSPRTRSSARTARSRTSRSEPGATVVRTHGELAVIGAGATVGPFSYLRPGTELGARRQDRRLRGDQERPDRRRRQGPAPVLRRRRRDRRGHQHRRRHDLRQLRRRRQAPHDDRPAGPDRLEQHLRRPGRRSGTVPRPVPGPSYGATCRPARWRSRAGPQRAIEGWTLRKRAGHADGQRRGGRAGRRRGRSATSHTDGTGLAPDGPSGSQSE